jgi:cysteine synthase
VQMESMNVGGTGKDRAAQRMLETAAKEGKLKPGGHVVEGTSGSTGISLACLCLAHGYKLHVVMPDDQADEKRVLLERWVTAAYSQHPLCIPSFYSIQKLIMPHIRLGVDVIVVPCCAISNKQHYVRVARAKAAELGGFFVNQFENMANFEVHRSVTGVEILSQCRELSGGAPDAFVMSAGTGGTIGGVSRYPPVPLCSITSQLVNRHKLLRFSAASA